MNREAVRPRIRIEHPRAPEPSRATLWASLVGKNPDAMVTIEMSEAQLMVLAEEALRAANILRLKREEGR